MNIKMWKVLVVALVSAYPAAAPAQDAVTVDPAHYKVVFESASLRVLRIGYAQGAKSSMHQHPAAIVVPLAAATVRFALPDGKSELSELANESAMYMPAGTHNPANVGSGAVDALLIEFKAAAPGKAALPASRPGMDVKVLAEGPYATAYRSTASATFAEPVGTTRDYDQVVIALGPTRLSLSIDGKPEKTTWARGDVQFVGRGVAHEATSTVGKPMDMVVVAIR